MLDGVALAMQVASRARVVVGFLIVATSGSALAVSGPKAATAAPKPMAPVISYDQVTKDALPPEGWAGRVDKAARTTLSTVGPSVASGSWVAPDTGRITVGVNQRGVAAAVSQSLSSAGLSEADVEVVENSQSDLDAIVNGVYYDLGMETISSARHDYVRNAVVLTSSVPVTDGLREQVHANYGDAAILLSEPEQFAPASSRDADSTPFYAGAAEGHYNSGVWCTIGFAWVTAAGNDRMLTAGHCYPSNGSDDSAATDYVHPFIYRMGVMTSTTWTEGTGTVGTDGDLAMINTEKDQNGNAIDRQGAARMWTGGPNSTTSTSVNSVDSWTANGNHVCYSGRIRGVQCGTSVDDDGNGGYDVTDKDFSYNYGSEVITHVALSTKGWGKCSVGGESGSPVYINTPGTGVAAHGILEGGSGGGSDNFVGKYELGHCEMVFTEIGQAYDHWAGGHIKQS